MNDPLGLGIENNDDPLGLDPLGLFKEKKPSLNQQRLAEVSGPMTTKQLDAMQGVAEVGGSLLSGIGAMVGGAVALGTNAATHAYRGTMKDFDPQKVYADALHRMTYEPTTESGKQVGELVGKGINEIAIPLGPMGAGITGIAGGLTRAPKIREPISKPVKVNREGQLAEAVKNMDDVPSVAQDANADFFKQQALAKQQEALAAQQRQGQQPMTVDRGGNVSAMGAPGPLVPEQPMARMARDLGAEPFAPAPEFNPMTQMAETLPRMEELSRGREADILAEQRQTGMEQQVGRQTSLDMNAAERARREQAGTGFDQWKAEQDRALQERQAEANTGIAARAGEQQQADLFAPHTNMHRAYTEMFAATEDGKRPLTIKEFETTLKNLKEEPGTAMEMPVDVKEAYRNYLSHIDPRQGDLFRSHEILQATKDKSWEKLSPAEKQRAKAALDNITDLNANISKKDADKLARYLNGKVAIPSKEITRSDGKYTISATISNDGVPSLDVEVKDASGVKQAYAMFDGNLDNFKKQNNTTSYMTGSHGAPGMAREMYNFVKDLGFEVNPSKSQTTMGREMWKSWKEKGLTGEGEDGITYLRNGFTKEDAMAPFRHAGMQAKFSNSPLRNVPGISDRLKEVGNAMIESPKEAIDLALNSPDVQQNVVQKGVNAFTKGGAYLKAKVNNPVVHYTVDRFLKADGEARGEINSKVKGAYLGALRELTKEERNDAFTLLNSADLFQKTITPEFMQKQGLSENLQHFIQTHNNLMDDVLGKINVAREATGKKPITAREAYSAMSMTGDFRKVVYKTVDGQQQVVGVIGANIKNIGGKSLSGLEKKVLEKDPTLSFGPLQDMTKTNRSAKGTPHEAFLDSLAILGEDNPHIAEFLQTLKDVAKDDPSNYMGMHKHTMQKKGIWGMEGRKFWEDTSQNARDFFENQVKYAESSYNWSHLADAAKDVNEVVRHPEVVGKQDNAIRLADDYMQNALGINPSRMGKAMDELTNSILGAGGMGPSILRGAVGLSKQIVNTSLLALSPAFLAINLLQPMMAMPGMAAFLRGRGAASGVTRMTQGIDSLSKGMISVAKNQFDKTMLTPVEKGAFDYAKKNHVYSTDMVERTTNIEKGVKYYTENVTQGPSNKIENFTRSSMFHGLVDMLHEGGLTPKNGLYEQAHRFTDMAMVNYNTIEKPTFYNSLGTAGSLAYNLKSFGHNEISRWSMFARELGESGNAMPLLTQMATTIAMAGVMGLPFFSLWEEIYDYITKKMGKPRSLALDVMEASKAVGTHLGPNGAYALSNGAPTMLGVDLSTRTGLGDVIPSSIGDVGFAGGGKLVDTAKAAGRVAMNPNAENLQSLGMNVAPPVMQGPMDVALYQKNGLAYSKDPGNLRPTAKRNDTDILLKKIGLTGINESAQKQTNYQNKQLDMAYAEYRTMAMNTIAQDLFRNRPIAPETLDKYFKTGQGDPNTFATDLQKMAVEQNMSPQDALMLKQMASQRIPQLRSIQRRQ